MPNPSSRPVRIAVVGATPDAAGFARAIDRASNAELTALVASDRDAGARCDPGVPVLPALEILDPDWVDAAVVCVPDPTVAPRLLERGLHVLSVPPLAAGVLTAATAKGLVAAGELPAMPVLGAALNRIGSSNLRAARLMDVAWFPVGRSPAPGSGAGEGAGPLDLLLPPLLHELLPVFEPLFEVSARIRTAGEHGAGTAAVTLRDRWSRGDDRELRLHVGLAATTRDSGGLCTIWTSGTHVGRDGELQETGLTDEARRRTAGYDQRLAALLRGVVTREPVPDLRPQVERILAAARRSVAGGQGDWVRI